MAFRTNLFSVTTDTLPIEPSSNRSVIDYLSVISIMLRLPWMDRRSPEALLGSAYATALAIQIVFKVTSDDVLKLTENLLTWLGYKNKCELSHSILEPYLRWVEFNLNKSNLYELKDTLSEIYRFASRPAPSRID